MAQIEKYGREEQREWYGERDNEGSSNVAEEEKENDRDQNHSFGKVVQHRVQGVMKQITAIEHRNDFHTLGQNVIIELVHLFVNPFNRRTFFSALAHQHAALNHVRLVYDDAVWA